MTSRFVQFGLSVTALALVAGCTGSSSSDPGTSSDGSSSPSGSTSQSVAGIGHETQFVQPVTKSRAKSTVAKTRKLDGVKLVAFEPDQVQVRVFLKPSVTRAERAAIIHKVKVFALGRQATPTPSRSSHR